MCRRLAVVDAADHLRNAENTSRPLLIDPVAQAVVPASMIWMPRTIHFSIPEIRSKSPAGALLFRISRSTRSILRRIAPTEASSRPMFRQICPISPVCVCISVAHDCPRSGANPRHPLAQTIKEALVPWTLAGSVRAQTVGALHWKSPAGLMKHMLSCGMISVDRTRLSKLVLAAA